jgi:outer membrane protein assembly factor BamB
VAGGLVYVGFSNGELKALRMDNGLPQWKTDIAEPEGISELERLVDIDGSPILAVDKIYVVSFQGNMAAVDPVSGRILWQREASSYVAPVSGFGNLYLVASDDEITALDRQ